MKAFVVVAMSLSLMSCGASIPFDMDGLAGEQPRVAFIEPADGGVVSADAVVKVLFTRPIEPSTIDNTSLAIVKVSEEAKFEEMLGDISSGEQAGMTGSYGIDDERKAVEFRSAEPYEAGTYCVVATGHVLGEDRLPFAQNPSRASSPFVSRFVVRTASGEGGDARGGGSGGGGDGGEDDGGGPSTPFSPSSGKPRPERLVINEVLYDAAGVDTNGDVFIELYGDPLTDISSYKVVLVSGDDGVVKDTLTIPEGAVIADGGIYLIADARTGAEGVSNVAGADLILNFDPQNGPDCIQLIDEAGHLLDAVGYGGAVIETASNGLECFEGEVAPAATGGKSLSRTDGVDTGNNLLDFKILAQPSSGKL